MTNTNLLRFFLSMKIFTKIQVNDIFSHNDDNSHIHKGLNPKSVNYNGDVVSIRQMTLKKAKCLNSHLSDIYLSQDMNSEMVNGAGRFLKTQSTTYLVPDVCSHILIIIRAFYNSDARENSSLENFYVVYVLLLSIVHCNQSKDAKTD